ncbi:hypothetical protein LguiB_012587 [Lonicera macranthoides]
MPVCGMVQQLWFFSAPLHPLLLNTTAPGLLSSPNHQCSHNEKDAHLLAHGASSGVFIICKCCCFVISFRTALCNRWLSAIIGRLMFIAITKVFP